jgi:hypothetical protein
MPPNGEAAIWCSLKCPWAVFITMLVIRTFSSGVMVLPRACWITEPTSKSSK